MKRKNSVITFVIALITIMIMSTIAAFASTHSCGGRDFNQVLTSDGTAISYTANVANVYLDNDVELTGLNILVDEGKTLNLCLNGHVLKGSTTDTGNAVITVKGTLNLYDCGTTVHHFKDDATKTGLWVWDSTEQSTKHTVTGGVITGGNTPNNDKGAGICIATTGSATINACNITGNYARDEGVAICNFGNLVINGGKMQGNCTEDGVKGVVFSTGDSAKTKIDSCTITQNAGSGLALKNIATGNTAEVTKSSFNDNSYGMRLENGIVSVQNCNINGNKLYGIGTSNTTDVISIKNTNVKNNGDWGIEQHYGSLLIEDSTISGNGFRDDSTLFYGQGGVSAKDGITLKGEVTITGNNTDYKTHDYAGNLLLVNGAKVTLDSPSSKMKVGISILKWLHPGDPEWPVTISNEYGATSYLSLFTSDDDEFKLYENINEGKRTLMLGMSTFNDGWGYTSGSIKEASKKYTIGKQYEVTKGVKFEFRGWSTKRDDPDYIDKTLLPSKFYYAIWKNPSTGKIVRTEPFKMWMMDESCENKAQGWSYVVGAQEDTLTLDSCTVAGKDLEKSQGINSSSDKTLNIVLKGKNTLGMKMKLADLANNPYTSMRNGIMSQSNLCFTGTGSLTIYDYESGIETSGNILFDKKFTGKIVIYDSGSEWRPQPSCALKAAGDITVEGGNFELNNDNTSGINAEGSFNFKAGSLVARGNGQAISVGESGSFTISKATTMTANAAWNGKGAAVKPSVDDGVVTGFEGAKYIKLSTIKGDSDADDKVVKTGDSSNIALFLSLIVLAFIGVFSVYKRREN